MSAFTNVKITVVYIGTYKNIAWHALHIHILEENDIYRSQCAQLLLTDDNWRVTAFHDIKNIGFMNNPNYGSAFFARVDIAEDCITPKAGDYCRVSAYYQHKQRKNKWRAVLVTPLDNSEGSNKNKPMKPHPLHESKGFHQIPEEDEEPGDWIKIKSLRYNKKALLGDGSRGTAVYKGKFGNRVVAIKMVPSRLSNAYHMVRREKTNLEMADRHPNIIRYFHKEEDHSYSYLALELCEGSLEKYVKEEDFRERIKIGDVEILKQTTEGLKYLHSKSIAHRDLKPHNILIAEDNNEHRVVLADFGISKYIKPDINATASAFTFNQVGTMGWSAPEAAVLSSERENFPLDIFPLGCLYYYVLTKGSHPFGDKNSYTRVVNIDKGDYNLDINVLPDAYVAKPLIEKMISHDPKNRSTIDEIHKHPLLWDTKKRMEFIHACHSKLQPLTNTHKLIIDLENNGSTIVTKDWSNELSDALKNDPDFITKNNKGIKKSKKRIGPYDTTSVRDLLRLIRNYKQHYNQCSNDLKNEFVGPDAPEFLDYFTSRFPLLFMHVYKTMEPCAKDSEFSKYY